MVMLAYKTEIAAYCNCIMSALFLVRLTSDWALRGDRAGTETVDMWNMHIIMYPVYSLFMIYFFLFEHDTCYNCFLPGLWTVTSQLCSMVCRCDSVLWQSVFEIMLQLVYKFLTCINADL